MLFPCLQIRLLATLLAFSLAAPTALAQRPPNRGPALVVTAPSEDGILAPQSEQSANVFFKEVSEVATEIAGKVIAVEFDEGERVKQGQILVRLDDALLQKDLQARKALQKRFAAELQDSKARYERAEKLIADEVTTPQQLDQLRYEVDSDANQGESTKAEVERIQTLIDKNAIRAPFDGIVLDRMTELGEWKGSGDTVAVLALDNVFDVMVNVPVDNLKWIQPGGKVSVQITDKEFVDGEIVTVIPKGDVQTQTFPVKVRVAGVPLYEGMSVRVQLPKGDEIPCVMVPRDALLNESGKFAVFTMTEERVSRKFYVEVLGYQGLSKAGVKAEGLRAGQQIIVKGHERLRGGEPVTVADGNGAAQGDRAHADG